MSEDEVKDEIKEKSSESLDEKRPSCEVRQPQCRNLDDMKNEQLYLLEVLVNSIEVQRDHPQIKSSKEDAPPIRIRVKFIDFPCIEITKNEDFVPSDGHKPSEVSDVGTLQEKTSETSAAISIQPSKQSSKGSQKKLSNDSKGKKPEQGSKRSINVDISSGKSCLFPMQPLELIRQIQRYPIAVHVFRKSDESEMLMIGQSKVRLGPEFEDMIINAVYNNIQLPVSSAFEGDYILTNSLGEQSGIVNVLFRLSCFGVTVVTQFQMVGTDQEYIFQSSTKDNTLEAQKQKGFLYNKGPLNTGNVLATCINQYDINALKPVIATEDNIFQIKPADLSHMDLPQKLVPWRRYEESPDYGFESPCPLKDCTCYNAIAGQPKKFCPLIPGKPEMPKKQKPGFPFNKSFDSRGCGPDRSCCGCSCGGQNLETYPTEIPENQDPDCPVDDCNCCNSAPNQVSNFGNFTCCPCLSNSRQNPEHNAEYGRYGSPRKFGSALDQSQPRSRVNTKKHPFNPDDGCTRDNCSCYKRKISQEKKTFSQNSPNCCGAQSPPFGNQQNKFRQPSGPRKPSLLQEALRKSSLGTKKETCCNPKTEKDDACMVSDFHVKELQKKPTKQETPRCPAQNCSGDCMCTQTTPRRKSLSEQRGSVPVVPPDETPLDDDKKSPSAINSSAPRTDGSGDNIGFELSAFDQSNEPEKIEDQQKPIESQESEPTRPTNQSGPPVDDVQYDKPDNPTPQNKGDKSKGRRKYYKRLYNYTAGMYPGINIGHRHCVKNYRMVPKTMGWLWNTGDTGSSLKPRRGWRPGAIKQSMMKMIKEGKKAAGLLVQDEEQQTKTKSSRRTRRSSIPKSATSSRPATGYNNVEPQSPTLHIHKKDGAYFIAMNPMATESDDDDEERTPLMFKILPHEDEVSTSSESSLEIEFTAPGAFRKKPIKPAMDTIDTQYSEPASLVELLAPPTPKSKKGKKGLSEVPSSTVTSNPQENKWDADQPTEVSKIKK